MEPDYESRGGGGGARWMRWTGGGRGLREAVQQYLDAIESEPGHSWLSVGSLVCMWNASIVLCLPVFCLLPALRPTAGLNQQFNPLG